MWNTLDNGNVRLSVNGYNLIAGSLRDDNFSFQGCIKTSDGKQHFKCQANTLEQAKFFLEVYFDMYLK